MTPALDLLVGPESLGERLDRYLAAAQKDLSRNRLQELIRTGHVHVNGRAGRASLRLKDGDRVRIELPPPEPSHLQPEDLPLTIVHEDDAVLVIDKPAGLVVHPGAGVRTGTLVQGLLHRIPSIATVGGAGRPGIVHRLDRDTSGLLVVAKTEHAYRVLVEALSARLVARTYDALVWGDVADSEGRIEAPIGRDPRDRKRMAVVRRGGKPAATRWEVVERFGPVTHLRVRLETGRTHQIRVHLAHLRHPVVGDPVYGGRGKKQLSAEDRQRSLPAALLACLERQALHASRLQFDHPKTGHTLRFTSPLPADFGRALELLRAFRGDRGPQNAIT